jgi:hypothetical protein
VGVRGGRGGLGLGPGSVGRVGACRLQRALTAAREVHAVGRVEAEAASVPPDQALHPRRAGQRGVQQRLVRNLRDLRRGGRVYRG